MKRIRNLNIEREHENEHEYDEYAKNRQSIHWINMISNKREMAVRVCVCAFIFIHIKNS